MICFKTPTTALIWELWRNQRVQFVWGLFFGAVFLPAIILFCLSWGPVKANAIPTFPIVTPFIFLAVLGVSIPFSLCGAMTNARTASAPLAIAFSRPIGTMHFARTAIVFASANAVVCYLIPALVFRWLHLMYFPLISGAVLVTLFSVAFLTMSWSFRSVLGLMAAGILYGIFLVAPFIINTDPLSGDPNGRLSYAGFCAISSGHALLGLLALPPMLLFLIYMLERQRTGESVNPFAFLFRMAEPLLQKLFPTDGPAPEAFASETAAQRWFYWRKALLPMLVVWTIGVALVFLISCGIALLGNIAEADRSEPAFLWFIFVYSLVAAQLFGLVMAMLMANARMVAGSSLAPMTVTFSTFDFALPVHDSWLTRLRLRLLLEAMGTMVGMAMLAGLLWSALFGFLPAWANAAEIFDSEGRIPYLLYLALLGALLVLAVSFWVGVTATMLAVPYLSVKQEKPFVALSLLPVLFVILSVLDAQTHYFAWVWPLLRIAIAAGLVLLSCSIVYRAHRWGVLWRRCLLSLFAVWVVFVLLCGLLLPEPAKTSGDGPFAIASYIVLLCAVGGLVFSGPALAPLVLAVKRHQ